MKDVIMKNILVNTIKEHYSLTLFNCGSKRKLSIEFIIDKIIYVLRTGCQWSKLPVIDCSWKTIYHYFSIWSHKNLFESAYQKVLLFYTKRVGVSQNIIIDTSFVKNVFGRNCTGSSPFDRGRRATKVSTIVDNKGVPLCFSFHPGNKNDSRTLGTTIQKCKLELTGKTLFADKIYDTVHCKSILDQYSIKSAISKKRKTTSYHDNRIRIVVEHTFSWLDKFRRILVRYDGLVTHFRSFHFLAGIHIINKKLTKVK